MVFRRKQFHALERRENLYDGYRKVFDVDGRKILLLQHQGRAYLLENLCPHAAYPMQGGTVIGDALRCPMHGYLFRLTDGACTYYTEGPCRGLDTWQPVVQGEDIGLMY